jgi:hypothetical protein
MSLDYHWVSAKVGGEPNDVVTSRTDAQAGSSGAVAATLPCTAQLRLDVMPEATLLLPQHQSRRAALAHHANGF